MLLPHQLRIPLKPMGPEPSSVATQWDESDLLENHHAPHAAEMSASALASTGTSAYSQRTPDSPSKMPMEADSSDSDSDEQDDE